MWFKKHNMKRRITIFCVVAGAMLVAELFMVMFTKLSAPVTGGDAETTRMRYPVPVIVPDGMVAEID